MKLTEEQFKTIWESAKIMEGYDNVFFTQLYSKIFNNNLFVTDSNLINEIEKKQKEQFDKISENVKIELIEWFKNNTYDNCKIESFNLVKSDFGGLNIVPTNPEVDESFDFDKNGDKFFEELSKKHGIRVGFIYWAYSK